MKIDTLNLPSLINSNGKEMKYSIRNKHKINLFFVEFDSLNTIILTEKIESSEPCWDGYQVNQL